MSEPVVSKESLNQYLGKSLLWMTAIALFLTACGTDESKSLGFTLDIKERKLGLKPPKVKVKQGDTVTLNFTSDEAGSVHLHGYDIEREVYPNEVTSMLFTTDITGGFPITFHPGIDVEKEHFNKVGTAADILTHGALFESTTLEKHDSFDFTLTEHLIGLTIPFHNHMNHSWVGSITVANSSVGPLHFQIIIDENGSFHPEVATLRPGTTVRWTSQSNSSQRIVSGRAPTNHEKTSGTEHKDEHNHGNYVEEVTLGSLEVFPS